MCVTFTNQGKPFSSLWLSALILLLLLHFVLQHVYRSVHAENFGLNVPNNQFLDHKFSLPPLVTAIKDSGVRHLLMPVSIGWSPVVPERSFGTGQ